MSASPEVLAIVATIGGAVAGWVASGLAVVHRVNAIEQALIRIETRLDAIGGRP